KIKINPKLNAPGRFGKPLVSLNLLFEDNEKEIESLLKEIDQLDRKRYKITKKLIKGIEKKEGFENRFLIFEDLPESMCGIIGSKLVEKFGRPFLVMSKKKNIAISVNVDEPVGLYYGGLVAAPIFRDILVRIINHYQIPPEKDLKMVYKNENKRTN
ncbi:MAG: hypothetical protein ACPLZ9_06645, partial [Candidatus Ratteibacteria bacterium]